MARLPYPESAELTDKSKKILAMTPDINIFRMLGHCDTLIETFLFLGGAILTRTRLDPRLRELAIVRAAVHCGSAYELNQHDEIAREVGVTQDQLDALRSNPTADVFNEKERSIIRFTDEVAREVKASDESFSAIAEFLSPCEVQELIIAIGYYSMVGRFLETLEVDMETEADQSFVRIGDIGAQS
jgi:alkylhydroperoxidase family enzyme